MNDMEHGPGRLAADRALRLPGTAMVSAYGVAPLLSGSDARAAAEEAAQRPMMAEHAALCETLGSRDGSPGRELCRERQKWYERLSAGRASFPLQVALPAGASFLSRPSGTREHRAGRVTAASGPHPLQAARAARRP